MFTNSQTMSFLADQAFPVAKARERLMPLRESEPVVYRSGDGRVHIHEFRLLSIRGRTAFIEGTPDGTAAVVALRVDVSEVVRAADLVQAIGELEQELHLDGAPHSRRKITFH
jgi:hypothetical protein